VIIQRRYVAKDKPILFMYDSPNLGTLTMTMLRVGERKTASVLWNSTYRAYLSELTFSFQGSCVVYLSVNGMQVPCVVYAGQTDRRLYWAAHNYEQRIQIPFSVYNISINNPVSSGFLTELDEGYYYLTLPEMTKGPHIISMNGERYPWSEGYEMDSLSTFYLDDVGNPNYISSLRSSSSSGSSSCNPCSTIRF